MLSHSAHKNFLSDNVMISSALIAQMLLTLTYMVTTLQSHLCARLCEIISGLRSFNSWQIRDASRCGRAERVRDVDAAYLTRNHWAQNVLGGDERFCWTCVRTLFMSDKVLFDEIWLSVVVGNIEMDHVALGRLIIYLEDLSNWSSVESSGRSRLVCTYTKRCAAWYLWKRLNFWKSRAVLWKICSRIWFMFLQTQGLLYHPA